MKEQKLEKSVAYICGTAGFLFRSCLEDVAGKTEA